MTTDTDLINEIIYKLKVNNAGHFDRDNLLDNLDKLDFCQLSAQTDISHVDELNEELGELKGEIQDIIDQLEQLI